METLELKDKFIELRAKGFSYDKLVKELGKSRQTLINWGKEYENEIKTYRAVELEVLQEKYLLSKEHRIKTYGEVLVRLRKELSTRDISDLSTDKLVELILKVESSLLGEFDGLTFLTQAQLDIIKSDKNYLAYLVNMESKGQLKAV